MHIAGKPGYFPEKFTNFGYAQAHMGQVDRKIPDWYSRDGMLDQVTQCLGELNRLDGIDGLIEQAMKFLQRVEQRESLR